MDFSGGPFLAPGLSPAAEMLNVLGVPADVGPCLVDWLTRDSLDRLEIIAKINDDDWKALIDFNIEQQVEAPPNSEFPWLDPGRAHVAKFYGAAMTEEARRLLAEGYEQSKASAASRDFDATNLVRDASTKIGYISPDLLPDSRTLNAMVKSPAAYIDFSNFDESYAGSASKQRIRPTVDGKVAVTLEDDNDDQGKDALHPRFSMG
ncbi:hypothetical protein FOL47_002970 [Perkinsus chesapeaki]|uniref:Uncharacterized protein n=1 Tax=Perkinsus chesapeaki TaxID=330153 RepID=A0A7J6KMT7_PERCH|nr:hypothetical protein FOL47_002970 [Perkinsus chesapeaki]